MSELEKKVLEVLKQRGEPASPESIRTTLEAPEKEVREALWSLVERGDVKIVGEWKVQAADRR